MKAKLILLAEPILVSDERAQEGFNYDFALKRVTSLHKTYETHTTEWNFCRKIIAGIPELPSIVNALSEEDCKKIGWVDVEELAQSFIIKNHLDSHSDMFYQETFIEGFKAAQSLNEKKFSEEDIIKAYEAGEDAGYVRGSDGRDDSKFLSIEELLQSLSQPKEVDVEIEMEDKVVKVIKVL